MTATLTPAAIVATIRADWPNPYFGAVPYLRALAYADSWDDPIGCEIARDQIPYLLSNLRTWRGPVAREIKSTLRTVGR